MPDLRHNGEGNFVLNQMAIKILHMNINPHYSEKFESRHIGPDDRQLAEMLAIVKAASLDELIGQTVPASIRLKAPLNLPEAKSEFEFLKQFKKVVSKNKIFKSCQGTGYYNTITPGVILRNILENPGWYTATLPIRPKSLKVDWRR